MVMTGWPVARMIGADCCEPLTATRYLAEPWWDRRYEIRPELTLSRPAAGEPTPAPAAPAAPDAPGSCGRAPPAKAPPPGGPPKPPAPPPAKPPPPGGPPNPPPPPPGPPATLAGP